MNKDIIYNMTEEIAFKLGKFDFPHFYSDALWKVNKESFELAPFFEWTMGFGYPCKIINNECYTDWENIQLFGKLKVEKIKDISHKLSYIRGRLKSYSVNISNEEINICYANSYNFRDFIGECLQDVIKDKFLLLPQEENKLGRAFNKNCTKYEIIKSELLGTIPGTPMIKLIASKEIINYIIGK